MSFQILLVFCYYMTPGSGDGNNYIAVIVTVILVLLVISIGLLVFYLYHEKKLCFSQSTADASAASSANSLLHKSGGIAQDESPIDIKKKLPIPAEGEALLEQHITNPTADMNSNQHQKVYNPSGIAYEIIDESDIKEQTNIKHV